MLMLFLSFRLHCSRSSPAPSLRRFLEDIFVSSHQQIPNIHFVTVFIIHDLFLALRGVHIMQIGLLMYIFCCSICQRIKHWNTSTSLCSALSTCKVNSSRTQPKGAYNRATQQIANEIHCQIFSCRILSIRCCSPR